MNIQPQTDLNESDLNKSDLNKYRAADKLQGEIALIPGADHQADGGGARGPVADVRGKTACLDAMTQTVDRCGGLNVLLNNTAYQATQSSGLNVSKARLQCTLENNLLRDVSMIQAALPHLKDGDAIVNIAWRVDEMSTPMLMDTAASKGGIHAPTRLLALQFGGLDSRKNWPRLTCAWPARTAPSRAIGCSV